MSLLAVEGLSVAIGARPILRDVSLAVAPGETLALVGESGSGKSMTARAVVRLLPAGARASGRIALAGERLDGLGERAMNRVRGRGIGLVFQEPMTALNPVQPIGRQIAEPILWHGAADRAGARERVAGLLERVGLASAGVTPDRYPHELSGGQRQRVVIAIAIALSPPVVIADEPTSALDVTVQARVLDLLAETTVGAGAGLLLITHDLGVAARMADRVAIMREGALLETGPAAAVLGGGTTPYTRALVAAAHLTVRPAAARPKGETAPAPLVAAEGLVCRHGRARLPLAAAAGTGPPAVAGVDLAIAPGESVGLVGGSGSGKTTLANAILGLHAPAAGRLSVCGHALPVPTQAARRALYRDVQAVFQDPYGSFDPRWTVERIVAEPLALLGRRVSRKERRARVGEALKAVGLEPAAMARHPHAFSGGQRQRIAIARAIVLEPRLVVADEPVSALDMPIRGRVLQLFDRLNRERGIALLFISHDLAVVRAVTDRVLVMDGGRIVEAGPTARVLDAPRHPTTAALVAAHLDPDVELARRARGRPVAPHGAVG